MATASAEDDVALTKEEETALKTITDGTNKFAITLYKVSRLYLIFKCINGLSYKSTANF